MASEVLVATGSADKLVEIRAILAHSGLRLVSLVDLNLRVPPAAEELEVHDTFLDNAIAKARFFASLTGLPTLADDSGLVVDALAGRPGVRTRRFALDHGVVPPGTEGLELDRANNRLLLDKLAHVHEAARGAHYVCAAAYAGTDRVLAATLGTCRGSIGKSERGSGGFGYDPLFEIPSLGITFAELSPAQKNQRSHRAIAFRAIAAHVAKS